AYIAIASTNGKFGGLRAADANFFASHGLTGIYAPGVAFQGPVFAGNITAFDSAAPVLVLGSAADVRITGGDLFQANGRAVEVSGIAQLKFAAGSDSHGNLIAAKANLARLEQDGVDVTDQIVVNPAP
ncbi:MAG TPA: serine hydrolase, partial [Opitutus sp.]|nr:serine hydrolase [Opitutus sp.]